MLVKATKASKNLGIKIKELGRLANEGETFEVTSSRYRVLAGGNRFNAKFVVPANSAPIVKSTIVENNPVHIPAPKDPPASAAPKVKPVISVAKSPAKGQVVPKKKETPPEVLEDPEIILIEPGRPPVRVDKKLQPIVEEADAKLNTTEE